MFAYVNCRIIVKGDKGKIKNLMKFIEGEPENEGGEPRAISFAKIIPLPERIKKKTPSQISQWMFNHWGNEEDCHCDHREDNVLDFMAWRFPGPVVLKLSEKYPDLVFECKKCDDENPGDSEYFVVQNGSIIEEHDIEPGSKEDFDIFTELTGRDPSEEGYYYNENTGFWEEVDDDDEDDE